MQIISHYQRKTRNTSVFLLSISFEIYYSASISLCFLWNIMIKIWLLTIYLTNHFISKSSVQHILNLSNRLRLTSHLIENGSVKIPFSSFVNFIQWTHQEVEYIKQSIYSVQSKYKIIFLHGNELEHSLSLNFNPFVPNAPFLYPLKSQRKGGRERLHQEQMG